MSVEHALLATVIDRPLPKQFGIISNDRTNTLADRRNQPVRRSFLSADDVCNASKAAPRELLGKMVGQQRQQRKYCMSAQPQNDKQGS